MTKRPPLRWPPLPLLVVLLDVDSIPALASLSGRKQAFKKGWMGTQLKKYQLFLTA
jgi:hypothetical protein